MESAEAAQQAVEQLHNQEFQGRNLRVVLSRPNDD
jgi:RNA recognition motif-containing protein